ncbi:hypothetical protein F4677DRAFT_465963 [Hypoxylon crocopeplum]|nr:hypothetical protein F4677DRAFT_465963 [Hypoxylon crocopeplum]
MSLSKPSGQPCHIDRLSDEVLLDILSFAMNRGDDAPFFLERYIKRARREEDEEDETYHPGNKQPPKKRRRRAGRLPKPLMPFSQLNHAKDWVKVTTTCRRFYNLGKEAFFRSKTIAMTSTVPLRFLDEDSPFPVWDLDNQLLALRWIRSIVLVDMDTDLRPDVFPNLPRILGAFTNLEHCTLLFGFKRGHRESRITNAQCEEIPDEMQELLHEAGVSEDTNLEIAVSRDYKWTVQVDALERHIYPRIEDEIRSPRAKLGPGEFRYWDPWMSSRLPAY